MAKQKHHPAVKRHGRFLPTISEETEQVLWLLNSDKRQAKRCGAKKEREYCHFIAQNQRDLACQQGEVEETMLFSHMRIETVKDDSRLLLGPRQQKETLGFRSKGLMNNEAKALFPDFFPRSTTQDSCEDFSWKAKPTMEQILSGHHIGISEKCSSHDNFEYWRKFQLSF